MNGVNFIQKFLSAFFCFLLTSHLCFAQIVNHPFVPKKGRLLIIGQQRDSIDSYIQNMGHVPGGVMVYTSIQEVDGLDQPVDHGEGVNDAQYFVNSYPEIAIQLGLYMVGALDDIVKGAYDANIQKLGLWMKNSGCPIYLRIGYEFDLPDNNYDPESYVAAYRYIVDHLRAQGVSNVAYVWHSAALVDNQRNLMEWYPGDDYVDWFAVSFFNPNQIEPASRFFDAAREHQKSLMIAESTPAGLISVSAKLEWFRRYFDFINDQGVQVVSYINSNWNAYPLFSSAHWGDARIEQDQDMKLRWENETNDGYLMYTFNMLKHFRGQ